MTHSTIYLLHQAVAYGAEHYPEREAFRCGQQSLDFRTLHQRVRQLAGLLLGCGLQKGDRVGIWMNRTLETGPAVHGIMSAGGAFVPLDPFAPIDRIRFVLEDCNIRILITHPSMVRGLAELLSEAHPLTHIIGASGDWPIASYDWEAVAQRPELEATPYRLLEQDLAYIMYTSGSTGAPKGIMHTHYSGLSYAKLSAELYEVSGSDRIASHAQLHFDMSTFAYLTAPYAGATTVIIPEAYTKMPASLSQLMERERISIWYSVPLALTQLLEFGALESRNLESLRWVLFGGEPFPTKPLRALMEGWPRARFCNVYGPAEVNQCTYYHLPDLPEEGLPIPLGYVWNNTEVMILDADDQEVSGQEIGELLVRSATRMRAYWNQPELTAASFYRRPNPVGFEDIFYRTGDLVRRNDRGELMFMGRKDRQVKIRGYRVELNEIEVVLMQHDGVAEAAVYVIQTPNGDPAIAAQLIPEKDTHLEAEAVRQYAERQLPRYALPAYLFITDRFPRSSAGKIDYQQLSKSTTV